MSSEPNKKNVFLVLGRITILTVLIAPFALSGKFAGLRDICGLVFVLAGGAAMALMSFTAREIGTAFKGVATHENQKFLFWESASRNFWMVGVLGTLIAFVVALTNSVGGIEGIATRMATSLI
jgi:hypothetical protein